ncbi:hypothetical protein [Pseudomonas sp. Teo4]|uniref:hypothetical protein n=1 Tax=Pseudomonas sp. Teo4 TaxID=3064528 RepID=UPI002ABCD1F3|nr:hypothetical protein [Pseudomonas sp. Teo4]MDZ3991661.1 hypothetical protein [Pseudomonas sp. Teo4]
MARASIYDRISQKREAAEALARQQAEQEREAAEAQSRMPIAVPVLPLNAQQNALRIAGLHLQMPEGCGFRSIETTLELAGCEATFAARYRRAPEGLDLPHAVELYVKNLRERHVDMTLVRQGEALLAGHSAIAVDYVFTSGQERRHGRSVCAIISNDEGAPRQWLDVSTQINPDQSRMADWLIEFDAMLAGMTAQ